MFFPTIWRYLLSQYFHVLWLCLAAFVSILLTTRLQDIAQFAALGAEGAYILWFTLYQIPYILPIALPISCLISATLLAQKLSGSHELTSLRASGFSLKDIFIPIFIAAGILAIANFYLVSEIATNAHQSTRLLEQQIRSINPLILLENTQIKKFKGVYINTLGDSKAGQSANEVVIAVPNKDFHRLNVMLAEKLTSKGEELIADNVTYLTTIPIHQKDLFDHLVIENIKTAVTPIAEFSQMLKKGSWRVQNDYLPMQMLLLRIQEEKELLKKESHSPISQESAKKRITRATSEIFRRLSIGLSPLTFTLMGISFGISLGRQHSNRGVFIVIGLAALFLISFFTAKGFDYYLTSALLLYLGPHLLIWGLSLRNFHRVSEGIE